jgi:DNA-binding Lrp family transcriptional regulator
MNVIKGQVKLDKQDKELLQLLQDNFPVEERPWTVLGKMLGISEAEVLSRIQRLSSDGVIRKLRTILDAKKLNTCYSTLMAMKVPEAKMEGIVNIVNEYMSVTHNYRREHDYNLWFTVTTCGSNDLGSTVEEIIRRTGIPEHDILDLPTTSVFKIDVRFKFTNGGLKAMNMDYNGNTNGNANMNNADAINKAIIHSTQERIPLLDEPFAEIAKETGISQDEVIARLKELISVGVIKRLGISVNQRKIGIVANAVVAWKVPQDQVKRVGTMLSRYKEITHCYERVTVPGKWECNLFTVIHGYNRESVEETARMMAEAVGISDYLVMFSNEQFKRTSVMHPY